MTAAARLSTIALVAALSFGATSAKPITLRYGAAYSIIDSIYSLPVHIAQRFDFFKQQGLNVDIVVPLPGGSERQIAALYDDTVDVTHVATPFLVKADLAGADAVAIAAEFDNPIYSLVVRPEIKSFADLRGKRIGMPDADGSIAISIRRLLAHHGLKPNDFHTTFIPGTPARLKCLKSGECDAVPLGQPQDLMAAAQGYRILGLTTDAMPPLLYTVSAVSRAWAAKHDDALVRYVRGLSQAFRFIRDPANRDAVAGAIAEFTQVSPEIARQTLALYLDPDRGVLPKWGEIDLAGLGKVIAMMGQAGELKPPLPDPRRFVDMSYLRKAGVR